MRSNLVSASVGLVGLCLGLLAVMAESTGAAETGTAPAEGSDQAGSPFDTAILIASDPAVQKELNCRPEQLEAIAAVVERLGPSIWALRDVPLPKSRARLEPLLAQFERQVVAPLTTAQRKRLEQLVAQQRGPSALLWPDTVQTLSLSSEQLEKIRVVLSHTRRQLRDLNSTASDETRQYQAAYKIRSHEQELLLAILTPEQQKAWSILRGRRFDLSRIGPFVVPAPELQDADSPQVWLNSAPLSLGKLRGQVVVVHFWTFGCSNCIRNYEWYKAWQQDFAPKGVTIIGIHTPETQGERDLARLRDKAAENGLTFPILTDDHRQNWDAWGNNMWPSVYLVDRRGRVRLWWYGELNWAGRNGEKLVRDKIEELLNEPADAR